MRIPATAAHNRWHPGLDPVARVEPGDELVLETRDGVDGQLNREQRPRRLRDRSSSGSPTRSPARSSSPEPSPGMCSRWRFSATQTPDFGVNGVIPGFGFLADLFTEPFLVRWELDGAVARSDELPGVAVPACVHAGVVGVAPSAELMEMQRAREERASGGGRAGRRAGSPALRSRRSRLPGCARSRPGRPAGNLDIRRLVAGLDPGCSRFTCPVRFCRSGTCTSRRGDGEVCGTGIEIEAVVRVRVGIRARPAWVPRFPAYLTPGEALGPCFATTGIPVDDMR